MHGRNRRHRPAAGSGHARQLQPRRHHEFHGRRRARLQSRFRRRSAGQQRRCRQDHRAYPGSERPAERQAGRPRHRRGDAGRSQRRAQCRARVTSQASANGLRTVLQYPARRPHALFRRCRFSRAGPSAWSRNAKPPAVDAWPQPRGEIFLLAGGDLPKDLCCSAAVRRGSAAPLPPALCRSRLGAYIRRRNDH